MNRKKIILLLILVNALSTPNSIYSMHYLEKASFFLNSRDTPQPLSKKMNLLKTEKGKIGTWLDLPVSVRICHGLCLLYGFFRIKDIQDNPNVFLQYIYNADRFDFASLKLRRWLDTHTPFTHLWLEHDSWRIGNSVFIFRDIKKSCIEAKIDGYSALGMAVIAKHLNRKEKTNLIKDLRALGFKPTRKDKQLALFELYESTPQDTQRKFMLALGHNDPNCNLSRLPLEIIVHIANYTQTERSLLAG